MNTSVVKKTKNLKQQNFDGEDNWPGVVKFHCTKMSLVMSMRFIYVAKCNLGKVKLQANAVSGLLLKRT